MQFSQINFCSYNIIALSYRFFSTQSWWIRFKLYLWVMSKPIILQKYKSIISANLLLRYFRYLFHTSFDELIMQDCFSVERYMPLAWSCSSSPKPKATILGVAFSTIYKNTFMIVLWFSIGLWFLSVCKTWMEEVSLINLNYSDSRIISQKRFSAVLSLS